MATIWSLFDGSGIALLPWAETGHTCYAFNSDGADHGPYSDMVCRVNHPNITYVNAWIDRIWADEQVTYYQYGIPALIMAWPPCTDLANSGSRAWAKKRAIDPNFQIKAANTVRIAADLADYFGCPYMIENPVGMLSTLWRKADVYVHPWEYGRYLPEDDRNPYFPEIIPARDAYTKTTGLWVGNGFTVPDKWPLDEPEGLSPQYKKLGGKSTRTKVIRSLTPRGLAKAIYFANSMRLLCVK